MNHKLHNALWQLCTPELRTGKQQHFVTATLINAIGKKARCSRTGREEEKTSGIVYKTCDVFIYSAPDTLLKRKEIGIAIRCIGNDNFIVLCKICYSGLFQLRCKRHTLGNIVKPYKSGYLAKFCRCKNRRADSIVVQRT